MERIKDRELIFNAVVEGYYDIDAPDHYEEVEPLIYLQNIDLLRNGTIGIDTEVFRDAIHSQYPDLKDSQFNHIMQFFEDNTTSSDPDMWMTIQSPIHILQYTNCDDINNVKIFEGDLVKTKEHNLCEDGQIWEIIYYQQLAQFLAWNDGTCIDICDLYEPEIIGNIYQNHDLINYTFKEFWKQREDDLLSYLKEHVDEEDNF